MVQTRLRDTSPRPQESRDTSNNPHRDRQSAPAMQPSSVQHVQSMAATMAELTRQNQELTRELNSRRQHREGILKGIPRVKKTEEILNLRAGQGVPLLKGSHIWRRRWTR